jgi:flagellar secretion chaperone FliS
MDVRLSYREEAVQGATPLGLVVLLFEQMIEDVRKALGALHTGQIEARAQAVNHAVLVLGQLQSTLDFERGGEVARALDLFYNQIRSGLCAAHAEQSAKQLQDQMEHLMLIREAWAAAEQRTGERNLPGNQLATAGAELPPAPKAGGEWTA